MPRVSSIADVFEADNDDVIKVLKAKVKSVFKVNTSKGEHPSTFQDLVLIDDDGNELKCCLKGREPFPTALKNQMVVFLAKETDKNGWTGVYAKDCKALDREGGGEIRKLWVTATGEIVPIADYREDGTTQKPQTQQTRQAPAPEQRQTNQQQKPAQRPSQTQQTPPQQRQQSERNPEYDPVAAEAKAEKILSQTSTLLNKAIAKTAKLVAHVKKHYPTMLVTDEKEQAWISSIFITAKDRGCVELMPYNPSKPNEDHTKQQ